MNKEFVNETIQDIIIERDGYLEQVKELQQKLERYKNTIKNIEKLVDNQLHGNFVPTGRTDGRVLQEIENKLKELKGE